MEQAKRQMTNSGSDQQISNELTVPCHSRKIPLWLVLLDNIPTLLLFILGFLIINQISTIGAIIYGSYAIFSVIWFWAKICPYCHHYDTHACPCGYGIISPLLFKKKETLSFRKVFKRNLLIVFPNWFVPIGIAGYLLITHYTKNILILTIIFSIIGFIIIPLISKLVGCKNCEIKEECPWMTTKKV
ncbi:hypothetical protein A2Z67_01410 [Candidatus Woesebacteria bacterium RBG_13_36_22]|uniref:Uncharacterized protein n=1 Tax=Candidatus Woesebacteria bacterium RBG_13_36_22 TaxID=1802478 RepID=A0A1F7X5C9_9BACT|nr:MAG: hypothetical protein A2Z67_01410 [Candidatus Woesebacteria bacterium RBG_13_36_22]